MYTQCAWPPDRRSGRIRWTRDTPATAALVWPSPELSRISPEVRSSAEGRNRQVPPLAMVRTPQAPADRSYRAMSSRTYVPSVSRRSSPLRTAASHHSGPVRLLVEGDR